MRDTTAEWLGPMLEAALDRPDINAFTLTMRALMPMREAPDSWLRSFVLSAVPSDSGATPMAVDWIRFGQILRHELGWSDWYPEVPLVETDEGGAA